MSQIQHMKMVLFGGCYFPPTLPFEMSRFATAIQQNAFSESNHCQSSWLVKFWNTSPSSIAVLLLHDHELERRKDQRLSVMRQTMDGSVAERNVSTVPLEKTAGHHALSVAARRTQAKRKATRQFLSAWSSMSAVDGDWRALSYFSRVQHFYCQHLVPDLFELF